MPPDSVRFAASREVSDTRVHAPEGVSLTTTVPRGTSGMGPSAPQGAGVLSAASVEASDHHQLLTASLLEDTTSGGEQSETLSSCADASDSLEVQRSMAPEGDLIVLADSSSAMPAVSDENGDRVLLPESEATTAVQIDTAVRSVRCEATQGLQSQYSRGTVNARLQEASTSRFRSSPMIRLGGVLPSVSVTTVALEEANSLRWKSQRGTSRVYQELRRIPNTDLSYAYQDLKRSLSQT